MAIWTEYPDKAWRDHILPDAAKDPKWINDGSSITEDNPLSKRELFGLIMLAYLHGDDWLVGFDPDQHDQQNDGLITDGDAVIRYEHKVIVEEQPRDVLTELLATYQKYSIEKKGESYGKNRTMIIHINKESDHGGLIRISDLTHSIGEACAFDRVWTVSLCSAKGRYGVWHLTHHYPRISDSVAEIHFDYPTGKGKVTHCKIDL